MCESAACVVLCCVVPDTNREKTMVPINTTSLGISYQARTVCDPDMRVCVCSIKGADTLSTLGPELIRDAK